MPMSQYDTSKRLRSGRSGRLAVVLAVVPVLALSVLAEPWPLPSIESSSPLGETDEAATPSSPSVLPLNLLSISARVVMAGVMTVAAVAEIYSAVAGGGTVDLEHQRETAQDAGGWK